MAGELIVTSVRSFSFVATGDTVPPALLFAPFAEMKLSLYNPWLKWNAPVDESQVIVPLPILMDERKYGFELLYTAR